MILTGTPILLSTGKVKPVEKLRPGDVLRSHTGEETRLRELIPLRSKCSLVVVVVYVSSARRGGLVSGDLQRYSQSPLAHWRYIPCP